MKLPELLSEISRTCTLFDVGGFRPSHTIEESWLGKVTLYLPEEDVPIDKHGDTMLQLGQLYLPSLPFIPASMKGVQLITIFLSHTLEGDSDLMDGCWEIREYTNISDLVKKEFENETLHIKAFPLKSKLSQSDHPLWDGGGLTSEQEDAFLELEDSGEIDDFCDVASHEYGHKFGGYPSFCQAGVDLDPYEFVLQISSDEKINLNVIDGGNLTFWKHAESGNWKLYYDFY